MDEVLALSAINQVSDITLLRPEVMEGTIVPGWLAA